MPQGDVGWDQVGSRLGNGQSLRQVDAGVATAQVGDEAGGGDVDGVGRAKQPMIVQARGVLEAPAKIATKPSAANRSTGAPRIQESTLPSAAPMKNRGVTSPPLKPDPRVMTVKTIFQAQA